MAELQISDLEIQETERLLLPNGCHFDEDAIRVIRHWESADVSACPGSGKTTVLLAKLKLLADRMPLDKGAGICVLSHTNVAVNEIKGKLSEYAGKIMGYPNYVGTIQSFIDKFVVQPYIRRKVGRTVQPLDDRTYAKHMLHKMHHMFRYKNYSEFLIIFAFVRKCRFSLELQAFPTFSVVEDTPHISAFFSLTLQSKVVKR